MVAGAHGGDDPAEHHRHAVEPERRVAGECGCGEGVAGDARGVPAEGEEDREALAGIHVRGADGVDFCGAAGGAGPSSWWRA